MVIQHQQGLEKDLHLEWPVLFKMDAANTIPFLRSFVLFFFSFLPSLGRARNTHTQTRSKQKTMRKNRRAFHRSRNCPYRVFIYVCFVLFLFFTSKYFFFLGSFPPNFPPASPAFPPEPETVFFFPFFFWCDRTEFRMECTEFCSFY